MRIDPRPFEAAVAQEEADLAQATATQEKTELDEQRQNQLFERKVNSQQDYDNAIKANLGAKAGVEAARAALEQAKLTSPLLRSPRPSAALLATRISASAIMWRQAARVRRSQPSQQ